MVCMWGPPGATCLRAMGKGAELRSPDLASGVPGEGLLLGARGARAGAAFLLCAGGPSASGSWAEASAGVPASSSPRAPATRPRPSPRLPPRDRSAGPVGGEPLLALEPLGLGITHGPKPPGLQPNQPGPLGPRKPEAYSWQRQALVRSSSSIPSLGPTQAQCGHLRPGTSSPALTWPTVYLKSPQSRSGS